MALAIGLNSGSSFDSVDAVLVDIGMGSDGLQSRPTFNGGRSYDWPARVADDVLRAFENKLTIFELCRLNYVVGAVYAECARSLMRELRLSPGDVEVIGYDGQTIYQEPVDHTRLPEFLGSNDLVGRWLGGPYPCGLQIGEPAIVATECDTTVITQFRPSDHALGGSGAPLMQYLDFVAFRDIAPVLTLNIGGIANCQLADRDRARMMAFDTGPGNVMIDHAAWALFGKRYDAAGAIAASGRVNNDLLKALLDHPFFKRPPPRSAWRLDFGSSFADEILASRRNMRPEDLLATFTEFTAAAIGQSIEQHVPRLNEIPVLIASGGGVRNGFLVRRLAEHLPSSLRLTTSDEFGIPAQYKEAVKFAVLAYANVKHLANNIPAASGAQRFTVMGRAVLPPRLAKVHATS
jgi:anhydro-N-acetylmuramic acid kinase